MPERLRDIIAKARSASNLGDHGQAARWYFEAAERARQIDLPGELAFCLRHAAQSAIELGEASTAQATASEAAAIYDRLEPQRGLNYANAVRLVALANEGLGQGEDAAASWSEARRLYDLHGIAAGVAECDAHLGS